MIQNNLCDLSNRGKKLRPCKKDTSIVQIEAVFFMRLIRQKEQKLFSVSIQDINKYLNKQGKEETDSRKVLSEEY